MHTSYETCVKRNLIAPEAATALHVDAAKLALYLERRLTRVEVIESDRIEPIAADGRITELALDDGKTITADLYVDCTGFARAVHGKIAEQPRACTTRRTSIAPSPATFPTSTARRRCTRTRERTLTSTAGRGRYRCARASAAGTSTTATFVRPSKPRRTFAPTGARSECATCTVRHISFDRDTLRESLGRQRRRDRLERGLRRAARGDGAQLDDQLRRLAEPVPRRAVLRRRHAREVQRADARLHPRRARLRRRALPAFVAARHGVLALSDVAASIRSGSCTGSRSTPPKCRTRRTGSRRFAWAFNEVSWLDILNGYAFKYAKVAVPRGAARARRAGARREIAQAKRQAVDPQDFSARRGEPARRPPRGGDANQRLTGGAASRSRSASWSFGTPLYSPGICGGWTCTRSLKRQPPAVFTKTS